MSSSDETHFVASVLTQSPDGEIWLDSSGRPIWSNTAAIQLIGYTLEECSTFEHTFPVRLVYLADRHLYEAMLQRASHQQRAAQAQFRLVGKGGAINWVTMSWQPLYEGAALLGTRISFRSMALLSATVSSPINHLLIYRRLASQISKQAQAHGHNLQALYDYLVEAVVDALDVKRAGIWLFNETRSHLCCKSLYVQHQGLHDDMLDIPTQDYPIYMSAISKDDLVVADDALHHPITAELTDNYLRPLGITSMLDAPIQQNGQTVGVLCVEHGPGVRQWAAAEGAFADAIAEVVGQHLQAREQFRLASLSERLVAIINTTPDLVFTATLAGELLYLNPSGRQLVGIAPDEPLDRINAMAFLPLQEHQHRIRAVIPHILKEDSWSGEVTIQDRHGQHIPAWEYFLGHRNPDGRVDYISGVVRDLRPQKYIEYKLRQREIALQELNDELESRVADRTRQLQEVNANLETFAFSVSHDLKAPLRGIDGYSRLLADEFAGQLPDEAKAFIGNIRQAASSMSQLIDDLLAYSRLGRRELSLTRFSIRQAVERVLAEREHDLKSHRVMLVNHMQDWTIHTDLECFLQLMRNLMDNAIKFSHDRTPPTITLQSERVGQEIVLSVKDNGCGFDMKYHERIFSIFQRLHRTQDYPGTGVGLAIVYKAAERMQGRVWAESAPGEGAVFYLALPNSVLVP